MAKLPKALSSIRARSSSLANRSQDWQGRTTERSGSKIIAAMMDSGPILPRTIDDQITILLGRIKREQKRLDKAKAFGTVPIGRETQVSKDREAYILRKEGIINRMIFLLQELNSEKQKTDLRELHKFQNNPRSGEYVGQADDFVRLERGKIVPKKPGSVMVVHRNSPVAHMAKVKSMAQLVREEKLKKKTFAPAIQAEIDRVFEPVITEDDFEDMLRGEDD